MHFESEGDTEGTGVKIQNYTGEMYALKHTNVLQTITYPKSVQT
jgi:hypothetical protein